MRITAKLSLILAILESENPDSVQNLTNFSSQTFHSISDFLEVGWERALLFGRGEIVDSQGRTSWFWSFVFRDMEVLYRKLFLEMGEVMNMT